MSSGTKEEVARKVGTFVRSWRERTLGNARAFRVREAEAEMEDAAPKRVDDSEDEDDENMDVDA